MTIKIEREINNPGDFAYIVFKAAELEIDEAIAENKKRVERFKKPLPMPQWNVKEILENLSYLVEEKFSNPSFREFASRNRWDSKSSKEDWYEIAERTLKEVYLLPESYYDEGLFNQMCEIWPELTPPPELTEEQRKELVELQKKADAIIANAEKMVEEFNKLAKREEEIVMGTKERYNTPIAKQIYCLSSNLNNYHHDGLYPKWR